MPRIKVHDEGLRERLIDEAGRILAEQGPAALTTRRMAEVAGTSTTAIYSLFGDKTALLRAIWTEGFHRLAERFAGLQQTDDPLFDLLTLGQAYRANALANPHLYDLMFGVPFPEFRPDDAEVAEANGTFQALVDAVARCQQAGLLPGADPLDTAFVLHGIVHGMSSLELKGWLGSNEDADRRWNLVWTASPLLYQGHAAHR